MSDRINVSRSQSSEIAVIGATVKQKGMVSTIDSRAKSLEENTKTSNKANFSCPCFGGAEVEDLGNLKKELKLKWHTMDIGDVRNDLASHFEFDMTSDGGFVLVESKNEGISEQLWFEKINEYGENKLTPPKTKSEFIKFMEQMTGFFSLLLWGGAALCFVGFGLKKEQDNLYLGIVLAAVVFLTGVFGYCQERKSSNLMDSFKNMLPSTTIVIRDGQPKEINATMLVPGDIIKLKAGNKVPADVRVLSVSGTVEVDNASLTGEAEPVKRETTCTDENPLETRNLAFFGTEVVKGSMKCIVVSTGDDTVMGRIASLTTVTETVQTPINKQIHHFVTIVSSIAFILGISFFLFGWIIIKTEMITNLVFMIGIIVANVPEGLLATVTVCMALTAHRMANNNVLVKNLEGVETLGSTSCICSDKTGTLTQNMMTVERVVFDNCAYQADTGSRADKPDTVTAASIKKRGTFDKLLRCATLCNNVKWDNTTLYHKKPDPNNPALSIADTSRPKPFMTIVDIDGRKQKQYNWKPLGDATESALAKFAQMMNSKDADGNLDTEGALSNYMTKCNEEYPRIAQIPFNSKNKYQVGIHWDDEKKSSLLVMKGAPERIWNRCDKIWKDNGSGKADLVPFDAAEKEKIIALQEQCAEDGLRVLGFCELELPRKYGKDFEYDEDNANFPIGNDRNAPQNPKMPPHEDSFTPLNFLGLFAMIDPARPQVPGAVKLCKTAGIRVIMVTGDHPTTAQAIAQDVGIIDGDMIRGGKKKGPATTSDYEKFNKRHGLTKGCEPKVIPGMNNGEPIPWFNPVLAPAMVVPGWELIGKEDCDKFKDVWDDILGHTQIVFARTSPQQKLIIVENCQRRDEIVAVTGDGVNDAPALKKADIGVAMGIMGSDVSKEAADMILLDDNFASIVAGVQEGRLIFDNLKKSIAYTLSSNIPEIAPFLLFMTIQMPLALSTVLILCVDLGTDMVPAISMAWEDPESDIMKRPPRNAEIDALVTKKLVVFSYLQIGVIQAIAGFYTWFVVMQDYGYPPHIVPELGAFDNWGKRTIFCNMDVKSEVAGKPYANESEYLSKGKVQFRNLVGNALPKEKYQGVEWDDTIKRCVYKGNRHLYKKDGVDGTALPGMEDVDGPKDSPVMTQAECDTEAKTNKTYTMPSTELIRNYPFWDGPVDQCTFPIRNFSSNAGGFNHPGDLSKVRDQFTKPATWDTTWQKKNPGNPGGLGDFKTQPGHELYDVKFCKYTPTANTAKLNCSLTEATCTAKTDTGCHGTWKSIQSVADFNEIPTNKDIEEASKLATTNCDNCTEYSTTCNCALHNLKKKLCPTTEDGKPTDCLPLRGDSFTDGEDVATNRSFEALEYSGYRPYVHVDGRNSPFFKKEWFAYDVGSSDQEVPGLSKDVAKLIAFSVEPPAYYHVNTMKMDGTAYDKESKECNTGDADMKKTKNVMDTNDDCAINIRQDPSEWRSCRRARCQVVNEDEATTGTAKEMQVEAWYNLIDVQAKYYPGKGTNAADYKIDASVDDQPQFWNINFDGYEVDGNNKIKIKGVTIPDTTPDEKEVKAIIDAGQFQHNYTNYKTASRYDIDGKVCDGVCVNVVSRMVQKEALHHAQCAYFISIIVVQWADLVICKTRMNSMYHQGMNNPAMNFGLIFETILGALLCYTPGLSTALGTRPIKLVHWFPGCPYSVFIFCYDETRKYIMRKGTKVKTDPISGQVTRDPCWMERNTYY